MLLNKTAKAHDVLRAGASAGLNLQARRILILVDGKRSLEQVMAMLGGDILPVVDWLLREGYIIRELPRHAAPVQGPSLSSAFGSLVRATADVVHARAEQLRTSAPALPTAPQPAPARASNLTADAPGIDDAPANPSATTPVAARSAGAKRSLAAGKMYMLDMLQLQRTPEAADLRATIQCATDPAPLVDALLQGLRLIVAASNASYGDRVTLRLAEILPLDALPRLEQMRPARATPPALSIVA